MLDDARYADALAVPVQTLIGKADATSVTRPRHMRGAEYFRDAVARELIERFGSGPVYTGGLRVYLMTSMMADVLNRGSTTTARMTGFTLQAAGKTGTSNQYTDAWFVGYTPHLVTEVWIGYDKPQMIMDRGFASVVAVPAWARFMIAATRGAKDDWFVMPGSLVKVKLCRISGLPRNRPLSPPRAGDAREGRPARRRRAFDVDAGVEARWGARRIAAGRPDARAVSAPSRRARDVLCDPRGYSLAARPRVARSGSP